MSGRTGHLGGFVPRNAQIQAALEADPAMAAEVAVLRVEQERIDRAYRNLAAVRRAAHLTQTELAERLGVNQSAVSKIERRDDLLLSTLVSYLRAAGAEELGLYATVDGHRIDIELSSDEGGART